MKLVLDTRTDLMGNVSQSTLKSTSDRQRHLAFLVNQMKEDLAVLHEYQTEMIDDLELLLKGHKVRGSKIWLDKFRKEGLKPLALVEEGCQHALSLTKKKIESLYCESRLKSYEKYKDMFEDFREKAQEAALKKAKEFACIDHPSHSSTSTTRTIKVNSEARKGTLQLLKRREELNLKLGDSRQKKDIRRVLPKRKGITFLTDQHAVKIQLKDGNTFIFPPPQEDEFLYTTRELCIHLKPNRTLVAITSIITYLVGEHRYMGSTSAFMRKFKVYVDEGILPPVNSFGASIGRPPISTIMETVEGMNGKVKKNTSYISVGSNDASEFLVQKKNATPRIWD